LRELLGFPPIEANEYWYLFRSEKANWGCLPDLRVEGPGTGKEGNRGSHLARGGTITPSEKGKSGKKAPSNLEEKMQGQLDQRSFES